MLALSVGCVSQVSVGTQRIKVASASDTERYQAMVDYLASDELQGRGVGYSGLVKARDYLIVNLEEMAVRPGIINEQAASNQYTQRLSIRMPVVAKEKSLRVTQSHEVINEIVFDSNKMNVLGLSSSQSFVNKRVVFVGYGIVADAYEYDSYGDVDVDDAVVVMFRYEPMTERKSQWAKDLKIKVPWTEHASIPQKVKQAEGRGASAVVIVDPPSFRYSSLIPTDASDYGEKAVSIPVYHMKAELFEQMLELEGKQKVMMKRLESKANRGEDEPVEFQQIKLSGTVVVDRQNGQVDNVIGIVDGAGDLASEVVVVGAHYDHLGYGEVASRSGIHAIHNGADDNASGSALVMMLAEKYQQYVLEHQTDRRRTVVFTFFSAEERGLWGSRYMVNHLDQLALSEGFKVVAMMNYDMVGRIRENAIEMFESQTCSAWQDIAVEANHKIGFDLKIRENCPGMSDHNSFIGQQIPAVLFFSGMHEDYHRVSDTSDKINAEGAAKLLALSQLMLSDLVTRDSGLAYRDTESDSDSGLVNGSFLNWYTADVTAMRRRDLKAKETNASGFKIYWTPISKLLVSLRLKQGDQIVQINGVQIKDMNRLMTVIQGLDTGKQIELFVVRGQQMLKLTFTLKNL
ncbi:M20/M25/M40 family metallo-hydrolase [Poriferisphaera corsica]|nr:M20/M25/M40 family metallo-hydrolase [Poriferisphaera corsica]